MNLVHKQNVRKNKGFTIAEAIAATTILAIITSGVWVVVDRCLIATTNMKIKMQAFEVARENLEIILSRPSVKESIETGNSERYPGIQWENIIETFYEPINSQMWLRAICTAKYFDTDGEEQTIELKHWLTGLSKDQLLQILMRDEDSQEDISSMLIETIEDAAEYAGVSTDTIEDWLKNGMKTTDDGFFVTSNLDLFKSSGGHPSNEDIKNYQIASPEDLSRIKMQENKKEMLDVADPATGLTYGQMEQMDIQELWQILREAREAGN